MNEHTDQAHPSNTQTRVTVAEAAQLLGLSAEAVRSRVQRGTLKSKKERGTVYVLLDSERLSSDQTSSKRHPNGDEDTTQTDARAHLDGDQTRFIASLEGQIEWLRREVERKDTIIMSLSQSIAALEAPAAPEPRESDISASEDKGNGDVPPQEEQRSWWRRFFS
jgi:hypothetical protein